MKSNDEWKKDLTPEQYIVMREKGTERAGSGEYNDKYEEGTYKCAACDFKLFDSETKFDSRSGWPSFYAPITDGQVAEVPDNSGFSTQTEVLCAQCGGHLGHVFPDGPKPTGLRYCVNSVSLKFDPKK